MSNSTSFNLPTSTHNLHFTLFTPSTRSYAPLVLVFTGAGDIALSWHPFAHKMSTTHPVLLYDRSGLDKSELGPNGTTAELAAQELHEALCSPTASQQKIPTTGPYILCAHSYGAIVAREFIEIAAKDVAGMCLVDPASDRADEFFAIPDMNFMAVLSKLNYAKVTGLREESVLSEIEWKERAKAIRGNKANEVENFVEVCGALKGKRQVERQILGKKPLVVILAQGKLDYVRVYEAGVKEGNGTEEQRAKLKSVLEGWDGWAETLAKEAMGLSEQSRLMEMLDCAHNVQLLKPEAIVEAVKWVAERVAEQADEAM